MTVIVVKVAVYVLLKSWSNAVSPLLPPELWGYHEHEVLGRVARDSTALFVLQFENSPELGPSGSIVELVRADSKIVRLSVVGYRQGRVALLLLAYAVLWGWCVIIEC